MCILWRYINELAIQIYSLLEIPIFKTKLASLVGSNDHGDAVIKTLEQYYLIFLANKWFREGLGTWKNSHEFCSNFFFKPQEHLFFCLMLKYFKRRISACCFNLWLVDKEVRFGTAFWSFMCNNIRDKIISSGKTEENKKTLLYVPLLVFVFSVLFWVDIASGLQ